MICNNHCGHGCHHQGCGGFGPNWNNNCGGWNNCNNRWPGCGGWYPGFNRPVTMPWPPMNGCGMRPPYPNPMPPIPPLPVDDDYDYGGRINTTAQTITLAAGTPAAIPLAVTLPANGVTYQNPNAITITDPGDYMIYYSLNNGDVTEATTLTLQLRNNGVPIANTAVSSDTAANIQGYTIQTLAAGDVIDLTITSAGAVPLTLGTGTTASLIVKQLN